jgi:class 3 adenylate cyclase
VTDERRIRFRSINLGDVIVEEHDIFGDGVNVAARLEALAEPGGICISRTVRDQIRDKLSYPFEDMGEALARASDRRARVRAPSTRSCHAKLPHNVPRSFPRRWHGCFALSSR